MLSKYQRFTTYCLVILFCCFVIGTLEYFICLKSQSNCFTGSEVDGHLLFILSLVLYKMFDTPINRNLLHILSSPWVCLMDDVSHRVVRIRTSTKYEFFARERFFEPTTIRNHLFEYIVVVTINTLIVCNRFYLGFCKLEYYIHALLSSFTPLVHQLVRVFHPPVSAFKHALI